MGTGGGSRDEDRINGTSQRQSVIRYDHVTDTFRIIGFIVSEHERRFTSNVGNAVYQSKNTLSIR